MESIQTSSLTTKESAHDVGSSAINIPQMNAIPMLSQWNGAGSGGAPFSMAKILSGGSEPMKPESPSSFHAPTHASMLKMPTNVPISSPISWTSMLTANQSTLLSESPSMHSSVISVINPKQIMVSKDSAPEEDDDQTSQESTYGTKKGMLRGGRWTSEEHERFLQGFRVHGHKWKRVQYVVKTRTVTQVRTHAQKYLLKLAKQNGEPESSTLDGNGPQSFNVLQPLFSHLQPSNDVDATKASSKPRKIPSSASAKKAPKNMKLLRLKKYEQKNVIEAAMTLCCLLKGSFDPESSMSKAVGVSPNDLEDDLKSKKSYFCRKCKAPKKGHRCQYNCEDAMPPSPTIESAHSEFLIPSQNMLVVGEKRHIQHQFLHGFSNSKRPKAEDEPSDITPSVFDHTELSNDLNSMDPLKPDAVPNCNSESPLECDSMDIVTKDVEVEMKLVEATPPSAIMHFPNEQVGKEDIAHENISLALSEKDISVSNTCISFNPIQPTNTALSLVNNVAPRTE